MSKTGQTRFNTGMMETRSAVDCRLARKGGNPNAVRDSEAKAHIEALGIEWARALFYEDERTNPQRMTGIAAYFSALTGAASRRRIRA